MTAADQGDSKAQEKEKRVMMAYTAASEEQSFIMPELMAIPDNKINEWLKDKSFDDYRIYIEKALHTKEHILSEKEERILSLSGESSQTAQNTFSRLNDVDMFFGSVNVNGEEKPITHATYGSLIANNDRNVRKETYQKFYKVYEQNANTLTSLYK